MPLSRRRFCHLVGAGVPIAMLDPRRAMSATVPVSGDEASAPLIRLDSNENPYGPWPSARTAMGKAMADGGRYPATQSLVTAIAEANGASPANVLLTVGATEGLVISAEAFTRPDAALVTATPSYGAIVSATERLGHPVIRVPILADGRVDLDAMAERSRGAGLVYVCNPNNPTGSIVSAGALRAFIARVAETSPRTTIIVGEVYHEYIDTPAYATMVPEALANPRLLINRTFSKMYGLAGMRLGYLIGREETLKAVASLRVPLGANIAAMAAASASLADSAERLRQRQLNTAGRRKAERFFADRGWRFHPAEANYLFVDVKRDIAPFRVACEEKGLLIGRPYPPADTWARLTIGTPDEMRGAFRILETLL